MYFKLHKEACECDNRRILNSYIYRTTIREKRERDERSRPAASKDAEMA